MSPERTVYTVCSHDCPDSCGVLVTINEAGRATRVQGDPAHPVTRGFLCGKVAKYLDRVYSPDRLLYPMRRRPGIPKASLPQGREHEAFERISWDDAISTIADRFAHISQAYGPESILPYSYAGTIGALGYGSMDRRFFHRLGASQLDRTICSTAGGDALVAVYGRKLGTDTEHFRHARYILVWGGNVHGNNIHLWPMIEEARRDGARLVVIDPYRTRTAALADWHLPINPGTDTALALGLMHILIRDNLYDREYVAAHTHGFDQLADHVRSYTPESVAKWTGIPAPDIERLAREYATTAPAVIRMNYGIQRSQNGGTSARAVAMLPCLTGAWKHLGGGLQLSTSSAFPLDKAALERADLMLSSPLGRHARVVNMCELGHALNDLRDPAVHAVFVYNSNPAAVAPNQTAVLRGFSRPDLFTVVHEQFFTDTADYADILLPATTFLEHKDVQSAYGHYYLQLSSPAIEPLGEARSNVWVFSALARRTGFSEPCFHDTADDLIAQVLRSNEPERQHPWIRGASAESLAAAGGFMRLQFESEKEGHPFQPFADGGFTTPSGKAEFYSESLAAQGLDALPTFHPPVESRNAPSETAAASSADVTAVDSEANAAGTRRYPLEFLPRKADNYMNSTFANLEGHRKMEAAFNDRLEIHADDAAPRAIADGDWVEIYNGRGALQLQAALSTRIRPGVVAARLGWNKNSAAGANVNALTSERLTDIGRGATFYSTLVEVRKAAPPPAKSPSFL